MQVEKKRCAGKIYYKQHGNSRNTNCKKKIISKYKRFKMFKTSKKKYKQEPQKNKQNDL